VGEGGRERGRERRRWESKVKKEKASGDTCSIYVPYIAGNFREVQFSRMASLQSLIFTDESDHAR
jgi:hypothetical protein